MTEAFLELSFNSLSVAPNKVSPKSLCKRHVTDGIVNRMVRLRDHLAPVTNASISLHLGDLTDVPMAAKKLNDNKVKITSLDRPDVYPNLKALKEFLQRAKQARLLDAVFGLARRAHNVSSEKKADQKIRQGVDALEGPKIVLRTHAGLWTENSGKMGDSLRKSLRGKGVVIAVEIFAIDQAQSEYRQLVERLAESNNSDTEVYYDLDLGHLEEAKYLHPDRGKEALAFFEDVIYEKGNLVAVTSLNQYSDGDSVTHRNFLAPGGQVDHMQVARTLGRGVREGKLSPYVLTVAEFMPSEYKEFLSPKGIIFAQDFKMAFEEGAGNRGCGKQIFP